MPHARAIASLLVTVLILALPGCGKSGAPSKGDSDGDSKGKKPAKTEEPPAAMPDLPDGVEVDASLEVGVQKSAPSPDQKKLYEKKAGIETGTLKGLCFIPQAKVGRVPPVQPWDHAKAGVIKDPQKKEVDFFKQFKHRKPTWIGGKPSGGRYGVRYVFVWAPDILEGTRGYLDPPKLSLWSGHLSGRGSTKPCYMFVNDRVLFRNADPFPCQIVIEGPEPSKDVVFEKELPPNTLEYKPGEVNPVATAWNKHTEHFSTSVRFEAKVKPHFTKPIRKAGFYRIFCRRHAWQQNRLFVLDNPYFAMSDGKGSFTITGLPVGRHKLNIWHPSLKSTKTSVEVEITKGETSDVGIEFLPSDDMKKK